MKTLTTKGIILKRISYREADRILTVYTKDLGKITVLAKGIRKLKSKKRGDLELFNHTKIYLAKGKTWYIANQSELINDYNNIKKNPNLTANAFFIAEIFEKLTNEDEQNERLYKFIIATFNTLNTIQNGIHITNAFHIKMLNMSGFYDKDEFTKNFDIREKKYISLLLNERFERILKLKNTESAKIISTNINNHLVRYTESILNKKLKTTH